MLYILQFLKHLQFKKITHLNIANEILIGKATKHLNNNLLSAIKNKIIDIIQYFSKNSNYFLIDTYLSFVDLIKLQLQLGQIPVLYKEKYDVELILRKISEY